MIRSMEEDANDEGRTVGSLDGAADDDADGKTGVGVGVGVGAAGGHNFETLVKRNAWLFPQPEMDDETEALDRFWLSKGVTEEHQRKALVHMGTGLANGVAERELYRAPEALGHALERLERVFPPGTDVARMLWRCPEVIQLPLSQVALRLIALKRAFPRVNAERVVEGNPRALLIDDLARVAEALDELQREFPAVDMNRVVDFEPHIIQTQLPSRVRAIRALKPGDRSASLRAFYPSSDAADNRGGGSSNPTEPMKNPQLFAKVFLLTTDSCYPSHGNI